MQDTRKIMIAPDSFKGSLSAKEAAQAINRGILAGLEKLRELGSPSVLTTTVCPIADGGEGTLDALTHPTSRHTVSVTSTNGKTVQAEYGFIEQVAIIEMARAAGLTLVPEAERNAASATTYGVGELMRDALDRGFRKLLITVGGSGTNDGGCGMIAALGATFLDHSGAPFIPTGETLDRIERIDLSQLDPRLKMCEITVATDVTNPLCGELGATAVYGPQKGATGTELQKMESGMRHYASLLQEICGKEVGSIPGCGAGGGLATPLLAFCRTSISSGIESVLQTVRFDDLLSDAELVITGEGRLDRQSLYGKAISGVCNAAARHSIPVVCLVGCVGDDKEELLRMGIQDIRTTSEIASSDTDSIQNAAHYLERLAYGLALDRYGRCQS